MERDEVFYTSKTGTEWTPRKSQFAIDGYHNAGNVIAGIWTVDQYNEWLSSQEQVNKWENNE